MKTDNLKVQDTRWTLDPDGNDLVLRDDENRPLVQADTPVVVWFGDGTVEVGLWNEVGEDYPVSPVATPDRMGPTIDRRATIKKVLPIYNMSAWEHVEAMRLYYDKHCDGPTTSNETPPRHANLDPDREVIRDPEISASSRQKALEKWARRKQREQRQMIQVAAMALLAAETEELLEWLIDLVEISAPRIGIGDALPKWSADPQAYSVVAQEEETLGYVETTDMLIYARSRSDVVWLAWDGRIISLDSLVR